MRFLIRIFILAGVRSEAESCDWCVKIDATERWTSRGKLNRQHFVERIDFGGEGLDRETSGHHFSW